MIACPVFKLYQIAFVLLLLVSCVSCDQTQLKSPQKLSKAANTISFVRDRRTGLCFAMLGSMGYGGYISTSIASVPCSDKVLALAGER